MYVSLDNIWFTTHTLSELVEPFHIMGGDWIFLDKVHRYPNWAIEIKNIYDSYPNMKIVFTESSMLEIYQSQADLLNIVPELKLKVIGHCFFQSALHAQYFKVKFRNRDFTQLYIKLSSSTA